MVRITLLLVYLLSTDILNKLSSSAIIDNDTNNDVNNSNDKEIIDPDLMTNAALIDLLKDHGFDFGDNVDISTRHKLIEYTKEVLTNESLQHYPNSSDDTKHNFDNMNVDNDTDDDDDDIEIIEINRMNNDSIHNESEANEASDETKANFLSRRELPDNATVWEIMKEQIRSDLAPFLMLIPGPIKRYISMQFLQLSRTIKIACIGALHPLTKPLSKVIMLLGKTLIQLANRLDVYHSTNSLSTDVIVQHTNDNSRISTLSNDDDDQANIQQIYYDEDIDKQQLTDYETEENTIELL